jgi:hypothetical protein
MIILGCITKYTPTDIKPYVESIDKSGYDGGKVMLVYDVPTETIEYLKSKGWDLYSGELHQHIILQRFIDSYKLLENYEDETVIWTDVKDVVFQRNPIEWINTHMGSELMAFSECVHFKDDSWAVVNAGTSYPMEWEWLQHKISYCAGTIVGKGYALKDLFIEIYRWSLTTSNTGQLSDQAAYNVLINLNHFKENVQFVEQEAGFVTQLGTVWVKRNELPITEPTPIYKDGKFYNQNGEEFVIVHQYDRDLKIKQEIINLYK